MRNPIRSESDAFRFTLLLVGLGVLVAIAGVLGGGWVALGAFLGIGAGVLVAHYLLGVQERPEPSVWQRRREELGRRRILVIASETVRGRALLDEVRYRARGYDAEVLVVAPALTSHVRHWTSDVDGARAAAQERLHLSLSALLSAGIRARGEIGDEDPVQALEDAMRTFGPDEVLISTHPPGRSNWLERGVIERARERFPDVPITHVVVDLEHERVEVVGPDRA